MLLKDIGQVSRDQEIPEESLKCRNLLLVAQCTKLKTVVYTIK